MVITITRMAAATQGACGGEKAVGGGQNPGNGSHRADGRQAHEGARGGTVHEWGSQMMWDHGSLGKEEAINCITHSRDPVRVRLQNAHHARHLRAPSMHFLEHVQLKVGAGARLLES